MRKCWLIFEQKAGWAFFSSFLSSGAVRRAAGSRTSASLRQTCAEGTGQPNQRRVYLLEEGWALAVLDVLFREPSFKIGEEKGRLENDAGLERGRRRQGRAEVGERVQTDSRGEGCSRCLSAS